jgi:hypothetical protein
LRFISFENRGYDRAGSDTRNLAPAFRPARAALKRGATSKLLALVHPDLLYLRFMFQTDANAFTYYWFWGFSPIP